MAKGQLTWSANGTLSYLAITDQLNSADTQGCQYTYDDLARVGGADANGYSVDCGAGTWQQAFSYDAFGNISKTTNGGTSFNPAYTANNQFTQGGLASFDGNGNMLSDMNNSYAWDPNWGTVSSVNGSSALYDALGEVVEQSNGSAYSEVLYSPVGKIAIMNGTSLVSAAISLPGGGKVVYSGSGLAYYRHADWLGSSRLASTQAQTVYSSTAYAPFGETYATSGTSDQSYTGQDSDTTSTIYDFPARRYNQAMGRWISPDPSGTAAVDPTNPQSWNRYAYVLNNPLRFVDPTGLDLDPCYDDTGYGDCLSDDGSGGGGGSSDGGGCASNDPNCVVNVTADPDPDIPTDPIDPSIGPSLPGTLAPNNQQVPVHGPWHYGNYCGAGGMGTPINAVDAACQQHDSCFGNTGADWTNMQSEAAWQRLSPTQQVNVQACNQTLCNAMTTISPTIPAWNWSEGIADWEINTYFHKYVPAGAQCHR